MAQHACLASASCEREGALSILGSILSLERQAGDARGMRLLPHATQRMSAVCFLAPSRCFANTAENEEWTVLLSRGLLPLPCLAATPLTD